MDVIGRKDTYMNLKVTIITPSYNQGEYLEETIQSVLNQTYSNIEYIVIDGGSTDNSVDIIRKYEERITYWCSEKDNGQADAINKGLKLATGDLVCWINSDDILYPNFTENFVNHFVAHPNVDFLYGDVEQGVEMQHATIRRGEAIDYPTMLRTLRVPMPQQATMWRKEVMVKIGYLDPQWHVLLDREYFMRIAQHCVIEYLPGVVAFFRNHENAKSIAEWHKWMPELEKYYTTLFEDSKFPYQHLKNESMASMYWECYRIAHTCNKSKEQKYYCHRMCSFAPLWGYKNLFVLWLVQFKHRIIKK